MSAFLKFVLGPRLIKIYASQGKNAFNYVPSAAEKLGETVLKMMNWSLQLGIYTSPIIVWFLFKKNYFSQDGVHSLIRLSVICSLIYASSLFSRAVGRFNNADYVTFINHLEVAKTNWNTQTKKLLSQYDFDFSAWPVEYSAKDVDRDSNKPRVYIDQARKYRSISEFARALPCQFFSYLLSHSVGIRILYPGTIIQHFIDPHLVDGRARFIEEHQGQRYKLLTEDGNSIDTMAVDRRGKTEHSNGDILVICCEGNAGFYEVGMIVTPLEAGYSVLGWNHPGFGGSTGIPFPAQEQNAVDIVLQFALNKLKFPSDRIIIYGWSIGGFTASWAAMNYPNVRAVMLDATFDHVLPLASNVMPSSWKPLVVSTVKNHMNLAVAEQLVRYPGPVVIFRRTRDEVISLDPGNASTNRGNELLIKFLKFRFPHIVDSVTIPTLRQWLSGEPAEQQQLMRKTDVSKDKCTQHLRKYADENTTSFPMLIGQDWDEKKKNQMALFLANRTLVDYDSTHCTPLPVAMFRNAQEMGFESMFMEFSDFEDITYSE